MNKSIFFKEVRTRWRSSLIWFLSLFALVFFVVWFYGSVDLSTFEQLSGQYPEELGAFFGDFKQLVTPEGFLNVEVFSYLPLMLAVLTISFGSSTLTKEEESGTLELLLASPISRFSILLQKSLAMVVICVFVSLSVGVAVALGQIFFDFPISLFNTFIASLASAFLTLGFGFFALAICAGANKRGLSIGLSVLLVAVSYFAYAFSQLTETIEPLKYFSLFYYYDSSNILSGNINWFYLILLLILPALLFVLGYNGFKNRDVGV